MKYSGIGGQAVIEGIMMMKGEDYAVAVRRPDKEIEVKKDTYQSITKKAKILQLRTLESTWCSTLFSWLLQSDK